MANLDFIDDMIKEQNADVNNNAGKDNDKSANQDKVIEDKVNEALTAKEKGFYNEMRSERQKRQEIQSQLDRLTNTLNTILASKKASSEAENASGKKFKGIPVAETEDGDLYIPSEHLDPILAARDEKIRNLEMLLTRSNASQNAETEAEKIKLALVGENESYGAAYQKYQAARKWASDQVAAFQRENGISGLMTSGQALDYVFDDTIEAEFNKRFPNIPLDVVITAEDSQRNFKNMLKTISSVIGKSKETEGDETAGRFKKLLRKPSGLGSTPNAKGGHMNVSEKLEGINFQDIMNLDDRQIKALQEALLLEEKDGGLTF
jgi:hypothetical protein